MEEKNDKKGDLDHRAMTSMEIVEKHREEIVDYLRRDVYCLHLIHMKFIQGLRDSLESDQAKEHVSFLTLRTSLSSFVLRRYL